MRKYVYIFIFIAGIILGVGIAYKKLTNDTENTTKIIPNAKNKRFGFQKDISLLALPGNYDFFKKALSKQCDFKAEILRLLSTPVARDSLEEGKITFLLRQWGYAAPLTALNELDSLPLSDKKRYRNYIFYGWAQRDPERLAYFYRDNRNQFFNSHALDAAIIHWAEYSPQRAIRFLSTLDAHDEKESLLSLFQTSSSNDPRIWKELSSLLPERLSSDPEVLTMLMEKWFFVDPSTSVKWLDSLSLQEQKSLEKYKGMGELPPIESLVDRFRNTPELISEQITNAPEWFQNHAWAAVLTDMSKRKGALEMLMWQATYVPQKQTESIFTSPLFDVPIFDIPGESPSEFEKCIAYLYEKNNTVTGQMMFIDGPYNVYLKRFSAQFPGETLSFLLKTMETGDHPEILASWMYDEPEKAQQWFDGLPHSQGHKQWTSKKIKNARPVGAIDKNHE